MSDSGFGPSQPGPVGPPDFSVSEAGWFRNFAFGFTAQWAIWDTYIPLHGGYENVYHDNRALKGIAEDLGGCWKAPKAILSPLWKLVARMRPDIYEISTGALYEIKPAGSEALARDTAVLEVLMLMGAGVPAAHLGPTDAPGVNGSAETPWETVEWSSPEPGVIIYDYIDVQPESPGVPVPPPGVWVFLPDSYYERSPVPITIEPGPADTEVSPAPDGEWPWEPGWSLGASNAGQLWHWLTKGMGRRSAQGGPFPVPCPSPIVDSP